MRPFAVFINSLLVDDTVQHRLFIAVNLKWSISMECSGLSFTAVPPYFDYELP